MKRRAFLKGIALLPVAAALPVVTGADAIIPVLENFPKDHVDVIHVVNEMIEISNKSSMSLLELVASSPGRAMLTLEVHSDPSEVSMLHDAAMNRRCHKYELGNFSFDGVIREYSSCSSDDLTAIKETVVFDVGPVSRSFVDAVDKNKSLTLELMA